MAFFESHKNSSIKSHEAYQKQFNIGRRSLLDLLDSANEMFVAKSAYANAKYDELFSKYFFNGLIIFNFCKFEIRVA